MTEVAPPFDAITVAHLANSVYVVSTLPSFAPTGLVLGQSTLPLFYSNLLAHLRMWKAIENIILSCPEMEELALIASTFI